MIRVIIADDHAVVRRGVREILAEDADILVIGEASSGSEALRAVGELLCDVILLDIAMPDGGGLGVLEQLRYMKQPPRVLILSVYSEKQYAVRAFKAGAAGYLTKGSIPEELITAVKEIAAGKRYISGEMIDQLVDQPNPDQKLAPLEKLSNREYQVMCQLASGKSVTEIAKDLSLSVNTISTYRARILTKLGLKNTAEIIVYAVRNNII